MRRGLEGANFFGYSLAHYYVFGRHRPGRTDVWAEYQQRSAASRATTPEAVEAAARDGDRLGAQIVQSRTAFFGLRGAIGTPDQIRDYLRRYEDCGVDQVILCSQAGKNRHEHIMESLELFGTKVLPEFIERDERPAARQGDAPGAGRRRPRWPASRPTTTRLCRPTTTSSPPSRAGSPTAPAATSSTQWLDDFAGKTALGGGREFNDLLG